MTRIVEPSIRETAFNCPHCFVLTTQYWYKVHARQLTENTLVPVLVDSAAKERILKSEDTDKNKTFFVQYLEHLLAGFVLIRTKYDLVNVVDVDNLHLSRCHECKKIAVWVRDRLLFPSTKTGAQPNPDLPVDIIRDFEEAREIVTASPRGAAALLRLCIQKLCIHLGEKGKTIDDNIASMVKKGLDPLIQQSLDIVRVIGNEAVHPGVLDLKDDRDTAVRLFDLVNAIVAQKISHPKTVNELYAKLPENKRKAIEARDKK